MRALQGRYEWGARIGPLTPEVNHFVSRNDNYKPIIEILAIRASQFAPSTPGLRDCRVDFAPSRSTYW